MASFRLSVNKETISDTLEPDRVLLDSPDPVCAGTDLPLNLRQSDAAGTRRWEPDALLHAGTDPGTDHCNRSLC